MIKICNTLYIATLMVFLAIIPAFSGTTVSSSAGFTPAEVADIVTEIDNFMETNGSALANAFALVNIAGYPYGKSNIGSLPHMFVGISFNVGMANMEYYDDDYTAPDYMYPMFSLNPVIYAGFGLTDSVDIMIKGFIWSDSFYKPPADLGGFSLSKLVIYSLGGKIRYQIIEDATILPGLFGFGGVAISAGGDFMGGTIGFTSTGQKYTVPVVGQLDIDFNSTIKWYLISANMQAIAYFDFLWIFTFYTGLGFSLNFGYFNLSATTIGTAGANNITAVSDYKYMPRIFIPIYIVGFDINIWLIKLSVESMVNLANRSDVNVQIGTRFQF